MKKVIFWVIILSGFWGNVLRIEAAENKGVYLSPPFIDLEINTGEKEKQFLLEVGNNGDTAQTFELRVVDFGSLDESGGVAFLEADQEAGDRKYALASWIILEKNIVTVAAGKKETVKVTVVDRESLMSGGHYGAVLATLRSEGNSNSGSVGLNQSLATLVYVLKSGGERKNLELNNLEWKNNWLTIPKQVKLRFENNGNVHVVPRGKVEIKDFRNKIVAKGIINEGSGRILPESFRIFPAKIKTVGFWRWPGKYTLEIDYRYDGKDDFSVYKKSFVYIGKEGVILGVIVLVSAVYFCVKIRRKNRQ